MSKLNGLDWVDSFFIFITRLGDWPIIFILTFILALVFWFIKKRNFIFPLFLAVFGSGFTAFFLKYLINRPRPASDLALIAEQGPSFPSAHATLIMAFLGFLIYICWQTDWSRFLKVILSAFFILLIILVGYSRLYLGVHFLSDIFVGYLIGLIWVGISMYILRTQPPRLSE